MTKTKESLADIDPDDLTREQAAEELERLAKEIAGHDKAYYEKDAPKVSDAEYDALKQRNAAIEARFPDFVRSDSPSKRVGFRAVERVRQGPAQGADAVAR